MAFRADSVTGPFQFTLEVRFAKTSRCRHNPRMAPSRSLPVLVPKVPAQRWSCHSCGQCCRTLVGQLSDSERVRIDEQGWAAKLGAAPYVRIGRGWALNKHEDGACVFLDDENRCRIHGEYGEAAKPVACRVFPFSVREVEHGWQASLRFDCPSVIASKGEPLSHHRSWLATVVKQVPRGRMADAEALLARGLPADPDELDRVVASFSRRLPADGQDQVGRLVELARATTVLQEARYEKVRGPRFAELLEVLLAPVGMEGHDPPAPTTPRQRGMLRQLAFAHAEHVTLQQRRANVLARYARRWRQLQGAKRFLRGSGVVPHLPGFSGGPTFDGVESVRPAVQERAAIEELVYRYLQARLHGRSVFGRGYYGWDVFVGLAALWLSIAVVGWLSRYAAAGAGRTAIAFDDVGAAIGVVDRAASRVPALGTFAEKARVVYLLRDDGIARLLDAYRLTDDGKE